MVIPIQMDYKQGGTARNHRKAYLDMVECQQHRAMESNSRSIVKAVSYRLLGSAVTGLIFFVLTRKGSLSLVGGSLDMVLKIGAYFVHERICNHIDFGREKPPEYEI